MQQPRTCATIFQDEPSQWGLRGDPYLWREIQELLADCVYPGTEAQFATLLEHTYTQLTGTLLSNHAPVFVERYNHGGMSSGYVSPQFWVEKAIPLLLARYRSTT